MVMFNGCPYVAFTVLFSYTALTFVVVLSTVMFTQEEGLVKVTVRSG